MSKQNMEKDVKEKERVRRIYAPKGERSQKTVTFRLDNENLEWLQQQHNKGRYINNLISEDRKRCEKK